jgi:putative methanogenesis marker protein 8
LKLQKTNLGRLRITKKVSRILGEHLIYCCGACVRISDKGIEVLTEPTITYCPLHEALYGTKEITVDTVRKSIEMKIKGFGFCCAQRVFDAENIVPYGASEMMHFWLDKGLMDCAVVVSEGAGTVITDNGKLVQAIGSRLTGIIETSPVKEIIKRIERDGGIVLDKTNAHIDQVEGVRHAFDLGFKHVVVSVAGFQARSISEIREIEKNSEKEVLIFSVCNTCVRKVDVKHIAKADVICASASRILRKEIGRKALMQVGVAIPIYALTEKGKKLVLAYLAEFKDPLVIFRTKKLPYHVEERGPRLK